MESAMASCKWIEMSVICVWDENTYREVIPSHMAPCTAIASSSMSKLAAGERGKGTPIGAV
jgi:hypothetical protein